MMDFIGNSMASGVLSLVLGAFRAIGILGVVALVAGLALFGGMRKFASTPKGMLCIAGVLIAALAALWFWPKPGWGSGGVTPASSGPANAARAAVAARAKQQAAARKKAVKAALWKKINTEADQVNSRAIAQMMAASMAGGMVVPDFGFAGGFPLPHIPPLHVTPVNLPGGGPPGSVTITIGQQGAVAPAKAQAAVTPSTTASTLPKSPANAASSAASSPTPASAGQSTATAAANSKPTPPAASSAKTSQGGMATAQATPTTATKPTLREAGASLRRRQAGTAGKAATPAPASAKANAPSDLATTASSTRQHRAERRARAEADLKAMTGMDRHGEPVTPGGGISNPSHHGQASGSGGHAPQGGHSSRWSAWNRAAEQEMARIEHQQHLEMQRHMRMGGGNPGIVPVQPAGHGTPHPMQHGGHPFRR
jgi:hypothetical protein